MTYQEVLQQLKKRKIEVVGIKCNDPQSGWSGEHLYIRDNEGFLNEDGSHHDKPVWGTLDFSGNGYNFSESNVKKVMEQIDEFYILSDVKDFESFSKYISKIKQIGSE